MTTQLNCIMLIDDDHPTNVYHRIIIEEGGFGGHIVVKQAAEAALAYLKMEFNGSDHPRPDLIFLDINMPRMNGWEFLEQYEKLLPEQRAGNIIVMLSTSANPNDMRRAAESPFIMEYHDKPLSEERLNEIISRYWEIA